jgi:hypothetical protein
LADYIDQRGRMKLLPFLRDHRKIFPTLWILVQKETSCRVTKVGCERFFALLGYVFAPNILGLVCATTRGLPCCLALHR